MAGLAAVRGTKGANAAAEWRSGHSGESDQGSEMEEILDQSVVIPEPEINLRFDDPFTDKMMWNLKNMIEICEVRSI